LSTNRFQSESQYKIRKIKENKIKIVSVQMSHNTQGFSGIAPITPSRGFSIEILTGVTLSWKTKSNKSISAMEDGIPR